MEANSLRASPQRNQMLYIMMFFACGSQLLASTDPFHKTYTAKSGETISGRIVGVSDDHVEIADATTRQNVVVERNVLLIEDQELVDKWHPGALIEKVALRLATVGTQTKRVSVPTGRLLTHVDVETTAFVDFTGFLNVSSYATATTSPEYAIERRTSKQMKVEARTTQSDVRTRLYCVTLKRRKGEISIAEVQYADVVVSLTGGEEYFYFEDINDYYGVGAFAINMDSGRVMAIMGSNNTTLQILQRYLK